MPPLGNEPTTNEPVLCLRLVSKAETGVHPSGGGHACTHGHPLLGQSRSYCLPDLLVNLSSQLARCLLSQLSPASELSNLTLEPPLSLLEALSLMSMGLMLVRHL